IAAQVEGPAEPVGALLPGGGDGGRRPAVGAEIGQPYDHLADDVGLPDPVDVGGVERGGLGAVAIGQAQRTRRAGRPMAPVLATAGGAQAQHGGCDQRQPPPYHAGRPMRLISHSRSTPVLSATSALTRSPSPSRSAAVASPVLIMKLACSGENIAPPSGLPRQPASSTSFQALAPGGFLKVEPLVFSRIGCVVSRRWLISSMVALTTAGSSGLPWNTAPSQMIEPSGMALLR